MPSSAESPRPRPRLHCFRPVRRRRMTTKGPSGNKYSMLPCSSRANRVIPVTVEAMPLEAHRGHLGVRHSNAAGIVAAIQL